jgi:hypothetical protein
VSPLVGRIERSLGPEVLATRVRIDDPWARTPWRPARAAWRALLRRAIGAAPRGTAFLTTDVRECYASIAPRTIERLIGPDAAGAVAILHRLADHGVRGLAVGPAPSAVLANAALAPLDAALRASGVRHVRWVDDLVAWGPRSDLERALAALRVVASALGLDLHDGKTLVLDAPADVENVVLTRRTSLRVRDRTTGIIAAP